MSLPPADQPFADQEEARKRKAEIEDMMRWQRDSYFRNEPVQQEYRDVVTYFANLEGARRDGTATDFHEPGPFDVALAQTDAAARNAYPRVDADDTRWLFDGGEAEARSIFRRDGEIIPDQALNAFPEAGVGKGDRLPAAKPELARSLTTGDPFGLPVKQPDDLARVLEVDTPLRFDGENRVEQLQRRAQIRKLAIKQELEDQINYAAQKNSVGVEVHSGGQLPEVKSRYKQTGIEDRTGGKDHDDGGAADIDLYVIENGKRRYLDSKNPADKKIMERFIRDVVAAGVTRVGHGYMSVYANGAVTNTRRIHVGGGAKSIAWVDPSNSLTLQLKKKGEDARTSNLPFVWLEVARLEGAAAREKLLKAGAWPNPTAPFKFVNRR